MLFDAKIPRQEKLNFIIYVFSRVLLSIGNHVYLFAVSYFILFQTGSAFYFSINMTISAIVSLILLPFSGLMSDFGNKRNIVIRGEILYTCVILGLLIYSHFFGINLIAIYVTTFFTSLINPFISNSYQAAMTELFHKNRIQKVSGYVSAIMSGAIIGGPVLGGILYGLLEFTQIITVFLILYLVSTILDYFLKFDLYYNPDYYIENKCKSDMHSSNTFQKFKLDISKGLQFINNSIVIKCLFIVIAFINFFGSSMSIFPEKMMITELGFSSQLVGYANAFLGIGIITAGLILATIKNIKNPLIFGKYALIGMAVLLVLYTIPIYINMSMEFNFIYIGIMGFLFAVGMQFTNTSLNIFIQLVVPQHIKGRVFSIMSLIASCLTPLSSIIYGLLYDLGGYWIINLTACISLLSVIFLAYTKKILDESKEIYQKALQESKEDIEEYHPSESPS